jgi:hypothetical protein
VRKRVPAISGNEDETALLVFPRKGIAFDGNALLREPFIPPPLQRRGLPERTIVKNNGNFAYKIY